MTTTNTQNSRFEGIIFDFDGVLIESEWDGNRHLAELLTELGHPTKTEEAITRFMGLSGVAFHQAIETWIGRPIPERFHELRDAENARALAEGVPPVGGAVELVNALDPYLPIAIASSSSSTWIAGHLRHIGLYDRFAPHIYSGKEHVAEGKPAPDIYLHAAVQLGVAIERVLIVEDSPVGVRGAVASGASVAGLCAARHCGADHSALLQGLGAHYILNSQQQLGAMLGLSMKP